MSTENLTVQKPSFHASDGSLIEEDMLVEIPPKNEEFPVNDNEESVEESSSQSCENVENESKFDENDEEESKSEENQEENQIEAELSHNGSLKSENDISEPKNDVVPNKETELEQGEISQNKLIGNESEFDEDGDKESNSEENQETSVKKEEFDNEIPQNQIEAELSHDSCLKNENDISEAKNDVVPNKETDLEHGEIGENELEPLNEEVNEQSHEIVKKFRESLKMDSEVEEQEQIKSQNELMQYSEMLGNLVEDKLSPSNSNINSNNNAIQTTASPQPIKLRNNSKSANKNTLQSGKSKSYQSDTKKFPVDQDYPARRVSGIFENASVTMERLKMNSMRLSRAAEKDVNDQVLATLKPSERAEFRYFLHVKSALDQIICTITQTIIDEYKNKSGAEEMDPRFELYKKIKHCLVDLESRITLLDFKSNLNHDAVKFVDSTVAPKLYLHPYKSKRKFTRKSHSAADAERIQSNSDAETDSDLGDLVAKSLYRTSKLNQILEYLQSDRSFKDFGLKVGQRKSKGILSICSKMLRKRK